MSAKTSLAKKGDIPDGIMKRIQSYDSILAKQRSLAASLCDYLNKGDWDEVGRHVNLINGLSSMIRDDARSILTVLSGSTSSKSDDVTYC